MTTKADNEEPTGATRRDALKFAGAAALGGLAASVAAETSAGAVVAHTLSNRFSFEIDGVVQVGITSVDTVASESVVVFAPDASTGAVTAAPGNVSVQSIRVTKDWSNTSEWYNWRKSAIAEKPDRHTVTVIIFGANGVEAGRMNFYQCWPCRWEGPSLSSKNSGHATESLTLVYETFDYKK